jgi:hypothetical protein
MGYFGMFRVYRFNAFFITGALGFSALLLVWRLRNLHKMGGGEFQHADWLINYSSGLVRRGISGEFFLSLASIVDVSPLLLVSLFQGVLTLILIFAVLLKGLSIGMSDRMFLLLLSPALVLFWINDTTGAYRKELLGLAAFLPLLLPQLHRLVSVASLLLLFAVGAFLHEANLVLAPALTFSLYLRFGRKNFIIPSLFLWGIAIGAAVFAVTYAHLPDTVAMCQRLLDAGLSEQLCHGIFPWLADGFDGTTSAVAVIILERVSLPIVALLTILLLFLPSWIGWKFLTLRWERAAFLISLCAVFALYPIATDWSRWLSMQVWAMTFLILILAETREGIDEPIPKSLYAILLSFNLGVGIDQIAPTPLAGFIFNVFASLENFLG